MKKGEFFIISIVLVALAILFLISFPRTALEAGRMDDNNGYGFLEEMIYAKSSGKWWSYNWTTEMKITTGSNETGRFLIKGVNITSGNACNNDIEVLNSSRKKINSNITSSSVKCNVSFVGTANSVYYVLYNRNYGSFSPGTRDMPAAQFNMTYSSAYTRDQKLCEYASNFSKGNENLSCQNIGGEKFSVSYKSKEFEYAGTI